MVLNNLALAYYWQKNTNLDVPDRIKNFKRDSEETIDKELKTVVTLLKDSIRELEGSYGFIEMLMHFLTLQISYSLELF